MCPIAHMPHHPCPHLDLCIIMAMCPITPIPITHVPHHPAPYAHVPHCPCALLPMYPITIPPCRSRRGNATLPICPITPVPMSRHIGDGAAKCQMMSSCQKDVYCQKIKYLDYGKFTKNKLT